MLQTRIPPPIYALTVALLMWSLNAYLPILDWIPAPWHRLGLVLIALALLADA